MSSREFYEDFVQLSPNGNYLVRSETNDLTVYFVWRPTENRDYWLCNCWDYKRRQRHTRGNCKHILLVQEFLEFLENRKEE